MKLPGLGPIWLRCLFAVGGLCAHGIVRAADPSLLQLEAIDPNPTLLSAEGKVISADTAEALDRLASEDAPRVGVIADGVSQLLLRVPTSNAVTFSVPRHFGKLRDVSEGADSETVTVQPRSTSDETWWAFALYTPPDDVPGSAVRRTFKITARDGSHSGAVALQLQNPPVLLVHGLWSDSSTWAGLKQFLKERGVSICEDAGCTVNYGAVQPAPSFDPLAAEPENQFAVNQLIEATTNTLNALRQDGIAAAQVDVVAHSLGGLIARSRIALHDAGRAYRRRENFQRGDFHKLITVGTPHRGTPAADFLVANRCVRSALFDGHTLQEYLTLIGRPLGPAIDEMQTLSTAITNIGATLGVPSHAIAGIAPRRSRTEQLLNSLPGALGFFFTLDELLGGNGHHDTIVPRDSQAGGLRGAAVTVAHGIVHTDVDPRDTGETESHVIWRRVAQLLRAPPESRLFGNFTALETTAPPAPSPPCLE